VRADDKSYAVRGAVLEFAANPRFAAALSHTIIGTVLLSRTIRIVMGEPALLAILFGLAALATTVLIARWGTFTWRWLLPFSLLAFLGWATLSLAWSTYRGATVASLVYLFVWAYLAIFVAVARDVIQLIRAFGDVLRLVLAASLAIEIFSGLLIDSPIAFLNIEGNLDQGGPIQGLLGSRNMMGLVAVVALITFTVELLTKSVTTTVAALSIASATIAVALTQSPVSAGLVAVLVVTTAALFLLRHLPPERLRVWQFSLAGATVVFVFVAWLLRSRLISWLDASRELAYRVDVWKDAWDLVKVHALEGWGWIGGWKRAVGPFLSINADGPKHASALNAYLDVLLQLGLVGLVLFVVLLGLAFVRSWLLACRQRSRGYIWFPLVLISLITVSLAESAALVDIGWFLVVACGIKVAENLSWRTALPE
jgi:exopolysaccharide production protein ExoQ